MSKQELLINELFHIRNQYGPEFTERKRQFLEKIKIESLKGRKAIETYHDTLLFLMAYPDNKSVYDLAATASENLGKYIYANLNIQARVYNTGVTGSEVCAEFSYEMAKWLRLQYKHNVYIDSLTAPDGQITSILSAIMPQVESEILQDRNSNWKLWLKQSTQKGEDLLDTLIRLFDQSPIRPEVKDELWVALLMYITVKPVMQVQLPEELITRYYHKKLIKHGTLKERAGEEPVVSEAEPVKIKLTEEEGAKILEAGRMVLVRYLREMAPITFSIPSLVSYYKLPRGFSIALMEMRPDRRRPIDSYMGYVVFKNGLPVSYGGSWVLFDSARMALNVFAPYRGGESQYIFEQILKVHKHVYHLNRFSVDPYQIGKDNSDGIKSGAFWVYYKFGFRPLKDEQKQIAEREAEIQLTNKGYRSSGAVMKKLSDSRLELTVGKRPPVKFDATDLSLAYANILKNTYGGDRKAAENDSFSRLVKLLKPSRLPENEMLQFILKNWCVLLMAEEKTLRSDTSLLQSLMKIFGLKVLGSEEEYIREMQRAIGFCRFVEGVVKRNI